MSIKGSFSHISSFAKRTSKKTRIWIIAFIINFVIFFLLPVISRLQKEDTSEIAIAATSGAKLQSVNPNQQQKKATEKKNERKNSLS